jgi:hypothetical protein
MADEPDATIIVDDGDGGAEVRPLGSGPCGAHALEFLLGTHDGRIVRIGESARYAGVLSSARQRVTSSRSLSVPRKRRVR